MGTQQTGFRSRVAAEADLGAGINYHITRHVMYSTVSMPMVAVLSTQQNSFYQGL